MDTAFDCCKWGVKMPKIINGKWVDETPEEIEFMKHDQKKREAQEKHRPLTVEEVNAMVLKQQINTLAVDDATAVRMVGFYPTFEEVVGQTVTQGFKFSYGGKLYKVIQASLLMQSHYPPGTGTESLYARIDEVHDGDEFDPIPYEGNMALENGKYYTQGGIMYHCIRDTGNPVYNALSELVGLYVEVVEV